MNHLISHVNDLLWGYVLIAALVACGLQCTRRTKGVQFRMEGEMFRLLTDSATSRPGIKEPAFHRTQLPEIATELQCRD